MIDLLAGILGILREFLEFLIGRRSLTVRWIKKADDQDLDPALHLLCTPQERRDGSNRGLSANQLDSPADIVRWLIEVEHETREHRCRLIDYLIVAKLRTREETKICGVMYCHYYKFQKLMFISYIVTENSTREGCDGSAAGAMLRYVIRRRNRELPEMEGVVFELERPGDGKKHKLECLSRWRNLERHASKEQVVFKQIGINYRQPQLSKWDDSYKEEPQMLMYGRTQPPPLGDKIRRDEAERVLSFIYKTIYGDCFEDDPAKDREYRVYLDELYDRVVSDLPVEVPVYPFPYNRKRLTGQF